MGSTANESIHRSMVTRDSGQEHACPQCGHAVPCGGAAGRDAYSRFAIASDATWRHLAGSLAIGRAEPLVGQKVLPSITMPSLAPVNVGELRLPSLLAITEAVGGGADGRRAELVGTLARFVSYLEANGILAGIGAPRGHHMLHKYAYIARGLGMRLDYEFDFLETGAFSVGLELDIFKLEGAGGGTEPFDGDARASAVFLDLVRGRDAKWLQAATFAMRERGRDGALDDFMAVPQAIIKHDAETARSAFVEVEKALRKVARAAP